MTSTITTPMNAECIPEGHKWCPGCASAVLLSSFSPDRARAPLFVRSKCKACVSKAQSATNAKRRQSLKAEIPTPQQHVDRMLEELHAYAVIWRLTVDITADDLLPLPPVCVLTLDDLIEGENPQAPTLAFLVEGAGLNPQNVVVISARARRKHQVIGPGAIRRFLGRFGSLPDTSVATLLETVERHNIAAWPGEREASAVDVAALSVVAIHMQPRWVGGTKYIGPDGGCWIEGQRLEWFEGAKVLGIPGSDAQSEPVRVYPMGLGPKGSEAVPTPTQRPDRESIRNWRDLHVSRGTVSRAARIPVEPAPQYISKGQDPADWPGDWLAWAEGRETCGLDKL